MQPLEENCLALLLDVALAQIKTMRTLAQYVGPHPHARETLFARPCLDRGEQHRAGTGPARRLVHHQRREFDEGFGDQQAPGLGMRHRAHHTRRVQRDQHHAAFDLRETAQDRRNIRGITELARQRSQRFRIGRRGFAYVHRIQVKPFALAPACSATTFATTIETRLPVGICRNSFGPCALECGPSTPVIRNCAFGNFSPSMPMNGMLPPSPMYTGGAPNASCEACATAASSHGDSCGAFQPLEAFSSFSSTLQPYGGSRSSRVFSNSPARAPSSVGGRRKESFTAVNGRSTLPALCKGGNPSTPVMASCGRQVRFNTSSVRSSATGFMPGRNGNLS